MKKRTADSLRGASTTLGFAISAFYQILQLQIFAERSLLIQRRM